MPSYRNGQPTGLTKTRLAGALTLGTRYAIAAFAGCSITTVRRYCVPVACDVGSHAELYDLDHDVGLLRTRRSAVLDGAICPMAG